MDLPCEKFRNLFDVDQVSKITVVVDCIYDDLTQVINHVIPTNTCAMQCNNVWMIVQQKIKLYKNGHLQLHNMKRLVLCHYTFCQVNNYMVALRVNWWYIKGFYRWIESILPLINAAAYDDPNYRRVDIHGIFIPGIIHGLLFSDHIRLSGNVSTVRAATKYHPQICWWPIYGCHISVNSQWHSQIQSNCVSTGADSYPYQHHSGNLCFTH